MQISYRLISASEKLNFCNKGESQERSSQYTKMRLSAQIVQACTDSSTCEGSFSTAKKVSNGKDPKMLVRHSRVPCDATGATFSSGFATRKREQSAFETESVPDRERQHFLKAQQTPSRYSVTSEWHATAGHTAGYVSLWCRHTVSRGARLMCQRIRGSICEIFCWGH